VQQRTKFSISFPWAIDKNGAFADAIEFYIDRVRKAGGLELSRANWDKGESSQKVSENFRTSLGNFKSENWAVACLDERGQELTSELLAQWIEKTQAQGFQGQAFFMGGAYGLPAMAASEHQVFSFRLSSMTFPHELALLVLLEQLYRAQCILRNHPYHHGEASAFSKERAPNCTVNRLSKKASL
jgi:23S rRNA (pseudouridine1915-N3)-methyltransferase